MTVVLTSRDRDRGEVAARGLTDRRLDVRVHALDVADPVSVGSFGNWALEHLGHLDILVNNAAIDYDTDQRAAEADFEEVSCAGLYLWFRRGGHIGSA